MVTIGLIRIIDKMVRIHDAHHNSTHKLVFHLSGTSSTSSIKESSRKTNVGVNQENWYFYSSRNSISHI
jgi:multisubunit Na+/H+ antiporter MnhG subunit